MRHKRTYLRLCGSGVIVAIRSSTERRTRTVFARANTSTLGQVLLTLRLANFDLLLLAAASKLLRLEGVLGLELRPAMLGNVSFGHGAGGLFRTRRRSGVDVRGGREDAQRRRGKGRKERKIFKAKRDQLMMKDECPCPPVARVRY